MVLTHQCPLCGSQTITNGKPCDNCERNLAYQKYTCPNCDATLQANATICENCEVQVSLGENCDNCGALLLPNAKFCQECGNKQQFKIKII